MATTSRPRRIDGDSHFQHTVDFKDLKELLPRSQMAAAEDMMWRDAERFADPAGVMASVGRETPRTSDRPDPSRDASFRLEEMDRLGFDTQVLITQDALPAPLKPGTEKPLWLRKALAELYNNAAAKVQDQYPGRYIPMATIPWDDIPASIKEMERVKKLGLKAVLIKGSYYTGQNLDAMELYPFWEAVSALDMPCIVHNSTQPCGGTILDHTTPWPMVGNDRYHRLHIGTYLGFGLDYAVACAALTLGGVLDEFPDLKFLFYEGGAGWMTYAMTGCDRSFYIERACSRTSTLPSELIKRHCLTAIESLEAVEEMVAAHGSDNFILGTDFPHPEFQRLPNHTTDISEKRGLSEEDKAKILGGNLARFLKVSPVVEEAPVAARV